MCCTELNINQTPNRPRPQARAVFSFLERKMDAIRYMDAARELNLLHLGKSAGVVYWKPAGLKLYENLRAFIRRHHEARGYQEVRTPSLVQLEVFERSGHLAKYRDYMFAANQASEQAWDLSGYGLRPMSCPGHIEVYESERRSHRELPLRLFEFGEVFRNEAAGALQVLFRQRQFCQDDSHVFVKRQQIGQEVQAYLEMARKVYAELGFDQVEVSISLRPELRFGADELWDEAEQALRDACSQAGLPFDEEAGGGAFYGPKIEMGVRDKLNRRWQLGVIQLDYVLPERFGLEYVEESDARSRPVMLHHAVLGSLERMVGILLEVHGVHLPEFLHPVPAVVVPVSGKSLGYAQQVAQRLRDKGQKVEVDESDDKLGAKLRRCKLKGVPNVWVVGEKEAQAFADGAPMQATLSSAGENRLLEL